MGGGFKLVYLLDIPQREVGVSVFGTSEGEVERIPWRPLFGDIEAVATAIGNSRKLWLVVEREAVDVNNERWWWVIYWKNRGRLYLLSARRTEGCFLAVV